MGGNEVKRARVGVFIGGEIRVGKNQLIWFLTNICQVYCERSYKM
jgi:hypothetical protein